MPRKCSRGTLASALSTFTSVFRGNLPSYWFSTLTAICHRSWLAQSQAKHNRRRRRGSSTRAHRPTGLSEHLPDSARSSSYVSHQIYLHPELPKVRGRSPAEHLPSETALCSHVRGRGFRSVGNYHQPPGPLGPYQSRGVVRLGGISNVIDLWPDPAAKMVADCDFHDLLQDALGDRGRLSVVARRRVSRIARRRNGPRLRLVSGHHPHRAM